MPLRHALATALLLGALVACDDDPEPKVRSDPTPTSTPSSASPTPTPTATEVAQTAPEPPAAAGQNSPAGAEAFVRYYVELVNYAGATGDSRVLRAGSSDDCAGCERLVGLIDETYGDGGHVEGGVWSIGRLTPLPLDHGADWGGFAKARSTPQTIVKGSGESSSYDGGPFYYYAYVAWRAASWRVVFLATPVPKP